MARFQIIAFDGGGIRGAFGLGFLQELESQMSNKVRDCFDLIAGTSTGAITALGMGVGLDGQDLVEFYKKYGKSIFTPRPNYRPRKAWLRAVYPWLKRLVKRRSGSDIDHFFASRYCSHALYESLYSGFGDRVMDDIIGPRVIVPTVNLTAGSPYIFGTPHMPMHLPDADQRIMDVLMATTAAPTYFPHHEMPDGSVHADGGLWAGSPGLLGLAEALRLRELCEGDHCAPAFSTNEIYLLTVGTGCPRYSLSPPGDDAGSLYWAQHVADVMMSSQVQGLSVPLKFLLSNRVISVNFTLPDAGWKLDSVEHMDEMFELGRKAARQNRKRLTKMFLSHTAEPYERATGDESVGMSDIGFLGHIQ